MRRQVKPLVDSISAALLIHMSSRKIVFAEGCDGAAPARIHGFSPDRTPYNLLLLGRDFDCHKHVVSKHRMRRIDSVNSLFLSN